MNMTLRPRPTVANECPIFRNNRVLLGYNNANRECWFGCVSVEAAEREYEGSETNSDWYRIYFSDTSEDDFLERRYTVSVSEMECITKLLNGASADDDLSLSLNNQDRHKRYMDLLWEIAAQKINVRADAESTEFGLVPQNFIPWPRADGRLNPTAGLKPVKSRGVTRERKRSRDDTSDEIAGTAEKRRKTSVRSAKRNFSTIDVADDEDDEELVPDTEQIECKTEGDSAISYSPGAQPEQNGDDVSGYLPRIPEQIESTTNDERGSPRAPENQNEMMVQDEAENDKADVDGNRLSIQQSLMQRKYCHHCRTTIR